eukprot:Nk52_evm75s158 gene=Nk52_evmTU75s158
MNEHTGQAQCGSQKDGTIVGRTGSDADHSVAITIVDNGPTDNSIEIVQQGKEEQKKNKREPRMNLKDKKEWRISRQALITLHDTEENNEQCDNSYNRPSSTPARSTTNHGTVVRSGPDRQRLKRTALLLLGMGLFALTLFCVAYFVMH